MLWLIPCAYTWKALVHLEQRLLCMHFHNPFSSKLKSSCCQKRWASFLLLGPAFPQFVNGILKGQTNLCTCLKTNSIEETKPNEKRLQADERASLLLGHQRAEMHDLGEREEKPFWAATHSSTRQSQPVVILTHSFLGDLKQMCSTKLHCKEEGWSMQLLPLTLQIRPG